MTFDATSYQRIVEKIKQLETELARTEGQKEQVMQELKSLFKVDTIASAEKLLNDMQAEQAVLLKKQTEQFDKLLALTDWNKI
jgi:uncharacterized protein (UPF0335 family)